MSNCCQQPPSPVTVDSSPTAPCCGSETAPATSSCCDSGATRIDWLFWIPLLLVIGFYALHLFVAPQLPFLHEMGMAVYELMNTMAFGLVIGIIMVALLSYLPRDLVIGAMGSGTGVAGIVRATAAGVLLDLCSHGILMVGAKLYERGVSIGQVMAFLIASPWNSLSLTIILASLIGVYWTLVFIFLSVVVAVITGVLFNVLVAKGTLPANPHTEALPHDFSFWPRLGQTVRSVTFSVSGLGRFVKTGFQQSRTVIKWLFIGVILAALIRTFVADDVFGTYFGPSVLGLAITMLAATIIEVCSEGSTPIAADIVNRAAAPGNGFAFLMAGVSTDYTEIMVLKSTTRSWRITLFLPLLTLPQIVFIALILNMM